MLIILLSLSLVYAQHQLALQTHSLQNQLYIITDKGQIYDYDLLTRKLNWITDLSQPMIKIRSNSTYPIYPADNGMFWYIDNQSQMKITQNELDYLIKNQCFPNELFTHTQQILYTIDLQNGELYQLNEMAPLFENYYENLVIIKLERKYITDLNHQYCDQYNTKIEINFLRNFLAGYSIPQKQSNEFKIHKKADNILQFSFDGQSDYIIETEDPIIDIIGFDLDVGFYNQFYTKSFQPFNALMLPCADCQARCKLKNENNSLMKYEHPQDVQIAFINLYQFLDGLFYYTTLLPLSHPYILSIVLLMYYLFFASENSKFNQQNRNNLNLKLKKQQDKEETNEIFIDNSSLDKDLSNPPQPPSLLQYDKSKILGVGCFGTQVYEGTFQGRIIAVKKIKKTNISGNILREIETLKHLEHKNIIRMYFYQDTSKKILIGLEKCQMNLRQFIQQHKQNSTLSPPAKKIAKQILKALIYLDENKIVHRDIKPDNILLTEQGVTKLADFGLAKFYDAQNHTQDIGSIGWRSKEVINNKKYDIRSDVFSTGCVMYFMATGGGHPFRHQECRIQQGRPVDVYRNLKDVLEAEVIDDMIRNPKHPREYLQKPFFWNQERKMNFIQNFSDQVEQLSKESQMKIDLKIQTAFAMPWSWKIDRQIITDLTKKRQYDYKSGRHLVRFIRNCHNHFFEMSEESRNIIKQNDYSYWEEKFPILLNTIYKVKI